MAENCWISPAIWGNALFSAAVGTANLQEVLSSMNDSADEIFKPRGSKQILNQAITNFKDAQKRIKDASLPVSDWKKLQKDLSDANADIDKIENDIEAKSKAKSRLERVNRVRGALSQRRNVLERIDKLGPVVLLPEDFEDKRKTASENLQTAGENKERLGIKLSSLNKELESLNVRDDLLGKRRGDPGTLQGTWGGGKDGQRPPPAGWQKGDCCAMTPKPCLKACARIWVWTKPMTCVRF